MAFEKISDWEGTDRRFWMLFDKVDDLTVDGGGIIDGNVQVWWKFSCKVDSKQVGKNKKAKNFCINFSPLLILFSASL